MSNSLSTKTLCWLLALGMLLMGVGIIIYLEWRLDVITASTPQTTDQTTLHAPESWPDVSPELSPTPGPTPEYFQDIRNHMRELFQSSSMPLPESEQSFAATIANSTIINGNQYQYQFRIASEQLDGTITTNDHDALQQILSKLKQYEVTIISTTDTKITFKANNNISDILALFHIQTR